MQRWDLCTICVLRAIADAVTSFRLQTPKPPQIAVLDVDVTILSRNVLSAPRMDGAEGACMQESAVFIYVLERMRLKKWKKVKEIERDLEEEKKLTPGNKNEGKYSISDVQICSDILDLFVRLIFYFFPVYGN